LPLALFGPVLMRKAERSGSRGSAGLPAPDVISKVGIV
jgi:hypothetical protein